MERSPMWLTWKLMDSCKEGRIQVNGESENPIQEVKLTKNATAYLCIRTPTGHGTATKECYLIGILVRLKFAETTRIIFRKGVISSVDI